MRKLWRPVPLHEIKPYGALMLGLFARRRRWNRERRS
jgi:hypothetical protein